MTESRSDGQRALRNDRRLLELQPDIYQRYELLRRIVDWARPSFGDGPIQLLDVGSGPDRLAEFALGDGVEVVRTDTLDIPDDDVVRIRPGVPLPFADNAFQIVIAMDVLEHVPGALRAAFLDECARVAEHLVIMACPTAQPDIEAAEAALGGLMTNISGERIEFLDEHRALELPAESAIAAGLEPRCRETATVRNAPLATWATANLVDFVVNLRLGDSETKARVNAAINEGSLVCPAHGAAYRRFVIGSPSSGLDVNLLAPAIEEEIAAEPAISVVRVASEVLAAEIKQVREDLETQQQEFQRVREALAANRDALELRVAGSAAARRQLEERNSHLRRSTTSLEEQLLAAHQALQAARDEFAILLEATALARPGEIPTQDSTFATPVTVRTVAGKAKRSPRWLVRQSKGAVRRLKANPSREQRPERFDELWYRQMNPDVVEARIDPWTHYVHHGRFDGRSPHPLFDRAWYAEQYPDAGADGGDPFTDWAIEHVSDHRNPNRFFEIDWYRAKYPEIADAGLDAVEHYRIHGWREGRRPGPLFDPNWYLGTYPDVADADIDPLTHYLQQGRGEGRFANYLEHAAAQGRYRPPDGLIPWFSPVNFAVQPDLADQPRLNVLLPGLGVRHLTGGPNTAIQIAYRLAALGLTVRFIATDVPLDDSTGPLWDHMASISGVGRRLDNVAVVDGSDRFDPVWIGENDLFMATAWWTAQSIKTVLPLVRHQRFLYLIQDFEPLFFASSSQYALAIETYGLDHVPIVNTKFLLDHLVQQQAGLFADHDFASAAIVFEPTVDRSMFRPSVPTTARTKRRLLFYARPQNGLRNLFELGVAAVQLAVQQGVFDESDWEFVGMGDPFEPVAVGPASVLRPLPWRDFDDYAQQMRESDILLSLMLAPHPSYPPLEMAACGGVAVTTEFGPKTAADLASISANIIGVPATIEDVAGGLATAVARLDDLPARLSSSMLALPATWDDVFTPILPEIQAALDELTNTDGPHRLRVDRAPADRYNAWRVQRIANRSTEFVVPRLPDELMFSLMTAVWNTPADFLEELADSVFGQDMAHGWEWVITDNGSTSPATIAVLERLATDPRVRIERSDTNLGILGGLRACLEQARGRYVLHLDHDDVLTTDALRIVSDRLSAAGWPSAFYSDEDKLGAGRFLEPYFKPDWDPVLFANSCYIAHLCGVDRELALTLDAYLDPSTEASPDWDLFMRFQAAGHQPLHVDEVLYSWRIHAASTAGDPSVKPYAVSSHRRVLERFIDARGDFDRFCIEIHPDSPDQVDWWIRRRPANPRPVTTVVIGGYLADVPGLTGVEHTIEAIAADDFASLISIAKSATDRGALIHLLNPSARILRDGWYWEALGLFELYPDVVAVGGPTATGDRLLAAGHVFGFGPSGWASPSAGEPPNSRGRFNQNLKQRSVDGVAVDHAVVDPNALLVSLAEPSDRTVASIGGRLAIQAAEENKRIVYSPLLRAEVDAPFEATWTAGVHVTLSHEAARHASSRHRSRWLSLEERHGSRPATRTERASHLVTLSRLEPSPTRSYHQWLDDELTARVGRYRSTIAAPSISIVTPVYAGTEIGLLEELAASLDAQTVPFHDWAIGIDGEVSAELSDALDRLIASAGGSGRIRTIGGDKRGILGTMRDCLEAITGDYYVPVDADDLLTDDALEILAAVVASNDRPGLVHSDEDVLDAGRARDPFLRPDWDPILHLSGSYVWHALCIDRELALEVGAYEDPKFEWCHDWDTVERIRRSGATILHVPEVLYHWRRHEGSSTNSEQRERAQDVSVQAMFQRFADDTGHPVHYEVTEFPLRRGAAEFHLRRRPVNPPALSLLTLGQLTEPTSESIANASTCPLEAVHVGPPSSASVDALLDALEHIESPLVWILHPAVIVGAGEPIWEAIKWFDLLDDVGAVCGRVVSTDGTIETGAELADASRPDGVLRPLMGRAITDPGPYALALKPHTIDLVDVRNTVVDRARLIEALPSVPIDLPITSSGLQIGHALDRFRTRVIYTPLLTALDGSPDDLSPRGVERSSPSRRGMKPLVNGYRQFV